MPNLHYKPCLAARLFTPALSALASFVLLFLVLLTTVPHPATAQGIPLPPPPTPPPASSTGPTSNTDYGADHTSSTNSSDQTQEEPTETLKVNVEVVQLFFNVKDKHGALIPN